MSEIEQAHNNLKNILLHGRIIFNGVPLTGNELSELLKNEQMFFEKATHFDKASAKQKSPPENDDETEN